MKLKHFYVCVCMVLMSTLCSNTINAKNVTVIEAGTLSEQISKEELTTLTELTVTGPLNGKDIATIRDMAANLKMLDIKNATIKEDNENSYFTLASQSYYTQENILGDYMFYAMTALTKIILPSSVQYIGSWENGPTASARNSNENQGSATFYRCVNLESIEFPSSLLGIGYKAFQDCIKLKSIHIPEGTEIICAYAFLNCESLTEVSLPSTFGNQNQCKYSSFNAFKEDNSFYTYFAYTFSGCKNLTTIHLSEGIKFLPSEMFSRCQSIINVELPNSLVSLQGAFRYCKNLKELKLPTGLYQLGSFTGCESLVSLIIPDGVTEIPTGGYDDPYSVDNYESNGGCFAGCYALTSVTLPSKLTMIPNNAFYLCRNLTSITIPKSVKSIGNNSFYGCTNLKDVTLSNDLNIIYQYAFAECKNLTKLTLPENLNTIEKYVFASSGLITLKITDKVASLGEYAFNNCLGLETITLPNRLPDINSYTFNNCPKLKDVLLPRNLISIRQNAFNGCSSLGKISIPGSVQTIEPGAFKNSGLTDLEIKDGITAIPQGVFSGCNLLKSVTFPPSMKRIAGFENTGIKEIIFADGAAPEEIVDYAFTGCDSLQSVKLPNSIKRIGKGAFQSCDTLQNITLPNAIDSINAETFQNCIALKNIVIPQSVKGIRDNAFFRCIDLEKVEISEGLIEIQPFAFYGCRKLRNITLPSTLTTIGHDCFNRAGLTSITIPEGIETIDYSTFRECKNLKSVTLPKSLKKILNPITHNYYVEDPELEYHDKFIYHYESGSFYGCPNLETVDFGQAAITEIDYYSFISCPKLQAVDLSATKLTQISDYTFAGDSLRIIKFPTTLNSIGIQAFANAKVEELVFPANLETIENEAFTGCQKIRSVDLSATSLTTIGNWFSSDSLRVVKLPETVTALANYAFSNCPIENINLPASLINIGEHALSSSKIINLVIPNNVTTIGNNAFINGSYDQVTIPQSVTSIGAAAFKYTRIKDALNITPSDNLQLGESAFQCSSSGWYDSYHLTNVNWNSTAQFPKEKFGSIDYLYLPENGKVSNKEGIGYIFYNGITDYIVINYTNNNNIYSYRLNNTLKTKEVTYTRDFNQTSGYGEAAGWQTIVLPFSVKEITYSKRYSQEQETISLAPFGSTALETAGTLPFWLYELGTDGKYKAATEIKAHQAYLICMPNNDKYPSENNINGEVKFAASDATNGITLGTTEGVLKRSKGTNFDLVPTYDGVMQHDTVYVLNENNWYSGNDKEYPAGSVFIKNYNENYSNNPAVYPFRAYLVTNEGKTSVANAPMFYSIGGDDGTITGIAPLPVTPDKATKAYSRNGVLYINTDADRTIRIYDVTGRTVRIIEAREGVNEVHGLDSGIYLLEGQKVAIGR